MGRLLRSPPLPSIRINKVCLARVTHRNKSAHRLKHSLTPTGQHGSRYLSNDLIRSQAILNFAAFVPRPLGSIRQRLGVPGLSLATHSLRWQRMVTYPLTTKRNRLDSNQHQNDSLAFLCLLKPATYFLYSRGLGVTQFRHDCKTSRRRQVVSSLHARIRFCPTGYPSASIDLFL